MSKKRTSWDVYVESQPKGYDFTQNDARQKRAAAATSRAKRNARIAKQIADRKAAIK